MKRFFHPVRVENTKRAKDTPDNKNNNVNEVKKDPSTPTEKTPTIKVKAKTYIYNTEW